MEVYIHFGLGFSSAVNKGSAMGAITDSCIAQMLNYFKVSGCKVGLIGNFGRKSLEYKRLIF